MNAVVKLEEVSVTDLIVFNRTPEDIYGVSHSIKFDGLKEWLKRSAQNSSITRNGIVLLKRPEYSQTGTSDYQVVVCGKERSLDLLCVCICQSFRKNHAKHVLGQPNSFPMPEDHYSYAADALKAYAINELASAYVAVLQHDIEALNAVIDQLKK